MNINNYIPLILIIFILSACGTQESTPIISTNDKNLGKIMPLGDSITYGNYIGDKRPSTQVSGFRNLLWYKLTDANYTIDFVGSQVTGESVTPTFDPEHEGHPNWSSNEIAENVYSYMKTSSPDIVLLHIGTNDRTSDVGGIASILDEIHYYEEDYNTTVQIFVALIIDRQSQSHIETRDFNLNLRDLIETRINSGAKNIHLVDMYRGANMTKFDYIDYKHPNDSGNLKMSTVWFNALKQL